MPRIVKEVRAVAATLIIASVGSASGFVDVRLGFPYRVGNGFGTFHRFLAHDQCLPGSNILLDNRLLMAFAHFVFAFHGLPCRGSRSGTLLNDGSFVAELHIPLSGFLDYVGSDVFDTLRGPLANLQFLFGKGNDLLAFCSLSCIPCLARRSASACPGASGRRALTVFFMHLHRILLL
jgi:hypothetical protein